MKKPEAKTKTYYSLSDCIKYIAHLHDHDLKNDSIIVNDGTCSYPVDMYLTEKRTNETVSAGGFILINHFCINAPDCVLEVVQQFYQAFGPNALFIVDF